MKGGEIKLKMLHVAAFTLIIVGAVNWGLIGLFNFNLVNTILASVSGIEQIVYILVGVSGVYIGVTHMSDCKLCSAK